MLEINEIFLIRNCDKSVLMPQLPQGFAFRKYRAGDKEHWYSIHNAIEHLNSFDGNTFDNYFGDHLDDLQDRMFFIEEIASGRCVATATAWFGDDYFGDNCGRIHWVGIHPEFRGLGLARPLLEEALYFLKQLNYSKTFLRTYDFRLLAIGLYLRLGFEPDLRHSGANEIWQAVADKSDFPELNQFL